MHVLTKSKIFYFYRLLKMLPLPSLPTNAAHPNPNPAFWSQSGVWGAGPRSNTAGLQSHPLLLGGDGGFHADRQASGRPRSTPPWREVPCRGHGWSFGKVVFPRSLS